MTPASAATNITDTDATDIATVSMVTATYLGTVSATRRPVLLEIKIGMEVSAVIRTSPLDSDC